MKTTIHYALVLDQSGSMQALKDVTISNFNEQIDSIRQMVKSKPDSLVKVTLCIFNDDVQLRTIAGDIDLVTKLDHNNYNPDSCTALYDAIGITMLKMQETVKPQEKVLLAIFTDGLENASSHYTGPDIAIKLEDAKAKGWKVRFFCYSGDVRFFREKLRLADTDLNGIALDDNGVRYMHKEIRSLINDIANATDNS